MVLRKYLIIFHKINVREYFPINGFSISNLNNPFIFWNCNTNYQTGTTFKTMYPLSPTSTSAVLGPLVLDHNLCQNFVTHQSCGTKVVDTDYSLHIHRSQYSYKVHYIETVMVVHSSQINSLLAAPHTLSLLLSLFTSFVMLNSLYYLIWVILDSHSL